MTMHSPQISQLMGETHDLAKWKIITVSAFAAVGLGWSQVKADDQTGLLLLFSVGFLCAYMDVLYYRKTIAIHTIARYLREYTGTDPEILEQGAYERAMSAYRKAGLFYLSERWAQFGASMVFTIGLPVLGIMKYGVRFDSRAWLACAALLLQVVLFGSYAIRRRQVLK